MSDNTERLIRRYRRMKPETHIEERALVNDQHRSLLEAGYDLTARRIDDERVQLLDALKAAYEKWQRCTKNLHDYQDREARGKLNEDDKTYGDFEYHKELRDAEDNLKKVSKRLKNVEKTLDTFFAENIEDKPLESEWCVMCQVNTPDQYRMCHRAKATSNYGARQFHYQGMHDLALAKESKLRVWLLKSSDDQDRRMLKRLDTLKKRCELTGPWYYKLSMLVCRKHVNLTLAVKFSLLSKEQKSKARRDPKQFWEAVFDRLSNFRKVNEERAKANGREWKLPTNDCTLDVQEVAFDPDVMMHGDYRISEDALIETIDAKSRWFLEAAMERAAFMRARRDAKKIQTYHNDDNEEE